MKILVLANRERYEKFAPDSDFVKSCEIVYLPLDTGIEAVRTAGALDADVLFADAITPIGRDLINGMQNLKLIHSEGVAFSAIDIQAAAERGIPVCNNKGCNSGAVAEQAILLMMALLRSYSYAGKEVKEGRQIGIKEKMMLEGITELSECSVGLIGFGDIAKETALRLKAFGCNISYYNRSRKAAETEEKYGVNYLPLDELLAECDIISLHVAVTPETAGMVNADFINKMKPTAFLINTARGELVDNYAMREALINGRIAGAGFDTIAPEPTLADNPLVDLPADIPARVEYSPHVGGVTTATFRRAHRTMWDNAERISRGEKPVNIVNL